MVAEVFLKMKRSEEEVQILQREMRSVIAFYQIKVYDLQKEEQSILTKIDNPETSDESIPTQGRYSVDTEGKTFLRAKLSLVESSIFEMRQHLQQVCETFEKVTNTPFECHLDGEFSDGESSGDESESDEEMETHDLQENNIQNLVFYADEVAD